MSDTLTRKAEQMSDANAKLKIAIAALQEIIDLTERPYERFPTDWQQQIANCPECQRYKGHPIQRGICDEHRKPLYAREDHDRHETRILGYRAKDVARDAIATIARAEASHV